ncbi:Signal transduction histidine kinase [Amycolatopsis marina]|uniref:histidine kinase n=2 Tax=Amycolatopsis marina TaxID=490629 RepID=A0A1I0WZS5_9PSEU|nr:Signal transduction histidine kinase [Amycolatopsis marina]
MGWLILLMAVVLLSVAVVTRNLLLHQAESSAVAALEQEAREFSGVAASGVDRATGQPFGSVRELLRNHLQRQYPDDDEVIVGVVRNGAAREVLRQEREAPMRLYDRPELLDPILAATSTSGSIGTAAGEMRWVKVTATGPAGQGAEGIFVVGYFIDRDRAEVHRTIRTLGLVSLLGLILTAGASWLVAGRILAPVRLARAAAAHITEHDFTRRVPVEGNDEFAALAEQFNAMLERLEKAFATQREFLDDAGHELRTPITIIRGHLELLDPVNDDPDERLAAVRVCTDELDRMSRIVDDLLLLAKAERPDFVQLKPVEVAELTSDIYAKIRALGDRRWRLESIGEGRVMLDEQRVTQAVVQLAHNAVQHTETDGEILLGSSVYRGWASFWIADRGPGVSQEDAAVIFDRFARGSNAKRTSGGAGLGLAIVQAIARAHHGGVRLVPTSGGGATFGLELPARGEGVQ